MSRPVVLVAEELAPSALAVLSTDFEVRSVDGADRAALLPALAGVDAVIVRSATSIDAEALAAADRLKVVARAGVGLDNVDVPAATARGVMVVNAPTSNIVSAAEHAVALLLAVARRVPQATASLKAGEWKRSRFTGVEITDKTMGVVGLGRIGVLVAQRMSAFGVRLLAYDPYVPAARAAQIGVRLVPLDELLRESDFISIHLPKTPETVGLIGERELATCKPGVIIINAARGGLLDEHALAQALKEGRVGGAGLDVYASEPCTDSPLFGFDSVVVTPHLGASTVEAQERVSIQTVEALLEALAGAAYVPAVNNPFRGPKDASGAVGWMRLAERTGHFLCAISAGHLSRLAIETWGLPEDLVRPVLVAAVKGALEAQTHDIVNYVNALYMASDRGLAVSDTRHEEPGNYARSIRVTVTGGGAKASADATLFTGRDARVVEVDGLPLEFRPEGTVVYLRNRDVPGVVGGVGTILGDAGINIADFSLARGDGARAAAVIAVDTAPPRAVLDRLRGLPAVEDVRVVSW